MMKLYSILVWCALSYGGSIHGYLDMLDQYAARMPEHPVADSIVWGNSDFTSFHKAHAPNKVISFLESWGYQPQGFFGITYFTTLLDRVLLKLVTQESDAELAVKITCSEDSQIIVLGNVRGEFHSLVRTLDWLEEQGFIDDNLVIRERKNFIIFDGYTINGSSYALETLSVILLLVERNPENVFWLRSRHENYGYWYDLSLKRELRVRGEHFFEVNIQPIVEKIDTFFNTLPHVLYASLKNYPLEFMRISNIVEKELVLKETHMGNLFTRVSARPIYYDFTKKELSTLEPIIKVFVKANEWISDSSQRSGLQLVEQDRGATVWSIFPADSPTDSLDVMSMNDSYVAIDLKTTLQDSSISFFERAAGSNDNNFVNKGTWNLISGISSKLSGAKVSKSPLRVGSSMALVKGVPIMGKEVKKGLSAKVNEVNQNGGINGHLIQTTIYNDDYIPFVARENIKKLLASSIDLILLPIGSPTLSLYLDYIKKNEISVLFPVTGGATFRVPDLKGVIHFKGSYKDEARALIDYLYDNFGARKFAFFYQDDAYGQGPLEAAHNALQEKGVKTWLNLPYTRAAIDFSPQVTKIREMQPDAIGFFATAQAAERLIRQLGVSEIMNKYLFGISFLGEYSFRKFIESYGIRVVFGSVVPNPSTSQIPIAQEYRKAMDEIKSQYEVFSFEAYIATSLFAHIVRQIDEPITREKIMAKLESLHNYPFKGLVFSFNPQTRSLAQTIWIETDAASDWLEKPVDQ